MKKSTSVKIESYNSSSLNHSLDHMDTNEEVKVKKVKVKVLTVPNSLPTGESLSSRSLLDKNKS